MKTRSKFILLGILSLLVGVASATPLLISELKIVPFWTVPEGPKANLAISVVYANFTIQDPAYSVGSNPSKHNECVFDYYVVLNITNLSNLSTKVSDIMFAAAKDVIITPSALGGFHGTYEGVGGHHGGSAGFSLGPAEGYLGHIGIGRVEGLWLDGEWINLTWVPESGLDEIWRSENIFPPKGLEQIWQPPSNPPNISNRSSYDPPYISYGGSRSNNTAYYTYSGTKFYSSGGNYWIEGVPLKEYIADNEVKATIIYFNGSWVDVTGRVDFLERPFLTATNMLVQIGTGFSTEYPDDTFISGAAAAFSDNDASFIMLTGEFDNTWKPYQSRLVLINGSLDISSLWKDEGLLDEGEITFFAEETNYLKNNIVNGIHVYTASTANKLEKIQLKLIEGSYIYNAILTDNQTFTTDSSGIEVFIDQERGK